MKQIQPIKPQGKQPLPSIDAAVKDAPRFQPPQTGKNYGHGANGPYGQKHGAGGHYPGEIEQLDRMYGLVLLGAAYHADEQLLAAGQDPVYLRLALDYVLGGKCEGYEGRPEAPIVQLPRPPNAYQQAA